jgi:hypothetical protein
MRSRAEPSLILTARHEERGSSHGDRPRHDRGGYRNDMPGFVPYHWNTGERLRRATVAAELRNARLVALRRIWDSPDPDTDLRALAAAVERYGLEL